MEKKPIGQQSTLVRTISNESFIEKLLLLLLTAAISGLLIPYISNGIQREKAHTDIIAQAQSKLYEDVARTLMTYETLSLDITWFKTEQGYNDSMHVRAFQRYQDRVPDLLADWRVESIKARELVSIEFSHQLDSFQRLMFSAQDGPVTSLYGKKATSSEWQKLHVVNDQMIMGARELISVLARELNLSTSEKDAAVQPY